MDTRELLLEFGLGKRIRFFRKAAGLTQKELAEMVGLNESTVRNYELDNRTPSLEILSDIADALKVSVFALKMPWISATNQVLHILFEMEELYALRPELMDGEIVLRFNTDRLRELVGDDPFAPDDKLPKLSKKKQQELKELIENEIPAPGAALDLENRVMAWYDAREDLMNGKIDIDTYRAWKMKFPAFAGFDEDDVATIFDNNHSRVEIDISWDKEE